MAAQAGTHGIALLFATVSVEAATAMPSTPTSDWCRYGLANHPQSEQTRRIRRHGPLGI
jgi:hypothetical protein